MRVLVYGKIPYDAHFISNFTILLLKKDLVSKKINGNTVIKDGEMPKIEFLIEVTSQNVKYFSLD